MILRKYNRNIRTRQHFDIKLAGCCLFHQEETRMYCF